MIATHYTSAHPPQVIESQNFAGLLKHRLECIWIPRDDHEVLARPNHSLPATYTVAHFDLAGTVLSREFHMSPHGDWDASVGHELRDHSGSFLLSPLGCNAITLTWESVLQNLDKFQSPPVSNSLVTPNDEIRFQHKLFKVCFVLICVHFAHPNTAIFRTRASPGPLRDC